MTAPVSTQSVLYTNVGALTVDAPLPNGIAGKHEKLWRANMAGLAALEAYVQEIGASQISQSQGLLYRGIGYFEGLVTGETSTQRLQNSWSTLEKLFKKVRPKLEQGEAVTIHQAIQQILVAEGSTAIAKKAGELLDPANRFVTGELGYRFIQYLSAQSVFDTETARQLMVLAYQFETQSQAVQTPLAIYRTLQVSNPEIGEWIRESARSLTGNSPLARSILKSLHSVSPDSVAMDTVAMGGSLALGTKVATRVGTKLGQWGVSPGKTLLAKEASFLASTGTAQQGFQTVRDVFTRDPHEALDAQRFVKGAATNALTLFGARAGAFVGKELIAPELIEFFHLNNPLGLKLHPLERLISLCSEHGMGLGGMLGGLQASESLLDLPSPPGGVNDQLGKTLMLYPIYSLAQGALAGARARAERQATLQNREPVDLEWAKLEKLAYSALEGFKNNPDRPFDFEGFFLEVERLANRDALTPAQWKRVERAWRTHVRTLEDSSMLRGAGRPQSLDEVEPLRQKIFSALFRWHLDSSPNMTDSLIRGTINCEGRCKATTAIYPQLMPQPPEGYRYAIQPFHRHIELVLFHPDTGQTYDLAYGFKGPVRSDLFHPMIHLQAFLKGRGAPTPFEDTELLIHRQLNPKNVAAGESEADFSHFSPFSYPRSSTDFEGGGTAPIPIYSPAIIPTGLMKNPIPPKWRTPIFVLGLGNLLLGADLLSGGGKMSGGDQKNVEIPARAVAAPEQLEIKDSFILDGAKAHFADPDDDRAYRRLKHPTEKLQFLLELRAEAFRKKKHYNRGATEFFRDPFGNFRLFKLDQIGEYMRLTGLHQQYVDFLEGQKDSLASLMRRAAQTEHKSEAELFNEAFSRVMTASQGYALPLQRMAQEERAFREWLNRNPESAFLFLDSLNGAPLENYMTYLHYTAVTADQGSLVRFFAQRVRVRRSQPAKESFDEEKARESLQEPQLQWVNLESPKPDAYPLQAALPDFGTVPPTPSEQPVYLSPPTMQAFWNRGSFFLTAPDMTAKRLVERYTSSEVVQGLLKDFKDWDVFKPGKREVMQDRFVEIFNEALKHSLEKGEFSSFAEVQTYYDNAGLAFLYRSQPHRGGAKPLSFEKERHLKDPSDDKKDSPRGNIDITPW